MRRRIMLLIAAAAMVAAMFAATATPAMAQVFGPFDGDADDFFTAVPVTTTPFVDGGCFNFNCGLAGGFDDFEHVGPLHRVDGLLCARVREGFDRSLECIDPRTDEPITIG